MTDFIATFLIDVELALRARSSVLATTRADPKFLARKNPGVLNSLDGNLCIFVTYTGIVVKMCRLTRVEAGDPPSL